MNLFQTFGDLTLLLSKIILQQSILKSKSCAGVSGKSQILLAVVCTAYHSDVFIANTFTAYITFLKISLLGLSYGTVYLIYVKFNSTYDHEHDTLSPFRLVLPAMVLAYLTKGGSGWLEVSWSFGFYLDSVAVLPQGYLLMKTGEAKSITRGYLIALVSCRYFYLFGWVYRYYTEETYDIAVIVPGVFQTLVYCDFFHMCVTKVFKVKKVSFSSLEEVKR